MDNNNATGTMTSPSTGMASMVGARLESFLRTSIPGMKNNFTVADAVNAAEGSMKNYATLATGQLEKLSTTSWPAYFLENVLIVAFAVALLVLYNDEKKWHSVVSFFTDKVDKKSVPGTTTNQPAATADIALVGPYTGDMNALVTTLRVRGFIVLSMAVVKDARTNKDQYKIFLALSSTLLSKLAVQHGLTAKTRAAYGVKEKARLCVRAMDVLNRSGVVFDAVTLLHDRWGGRERVCCVSGVRGATRRVEMQ